MSVLLLSTSLLVFSATNFHGVFGVAFRNRKPQVNASVVPPTHTLISSGVARADLDEQFSEDEVLHETCPAQRNATNAAWPNAGRWPTVFIIGTQKSATTSLWGFLKRHPSLCASCGYTHKGNKKEAHYWNVSKSMRYVPPGADRQWGRAGSCPTDVDSYLMNFRNPKCRESGSYIDATPNYIFDEQAPACLSNLVPNTVRRSLKFIVVLREPVARDLSYFNHLQHGKKRGKYRNIPSMEYYEEWATAGFQALQKEGTKGGYPLGQLGRGFYDMQLQNWWKHFDQDQFLVLSFKDLIQDFESTKRAVMQFIGVPIGPLAHANLPNENSQPWYGKTELGQVSCGIRSELQQLFAPHNENLYKMLAERLQQGKAPREQPNFRHFDDPSCPR